MEYIITAVVFLLFLYLCDKREEAINKCYVSHWMDYNEIHSRGAVQFIYVDQALHSRYKLSRYSVGLNINLNTKHLDKGIWIETVDGTLHRMSLIVDSKGKWVIQTLYPESQTLCKDNVDKIKLPRYTQNKAP